MIGSTPNLFYHFDIAIIRLAEDAPSDLSPACLPNIRDNNDNNINNNDDDDLTGRAVQTGGWGKTSGILNFVEVDVLEIAQCVQRWTKDEFYLKYFKEAKLCTTAMEGKFSYDGDSGGNTIFVILTFSCFIRFSSNLFHFAFIDQIR